MGATMTDTNKGNFRSRVMSADDVDIKAYASVGVGQGKRLIIFNRNQIDYLLAGHREGTSGIRLVNGMTIAVELPLDDLHRALRTPDFRNDNVIDLSAQTKATAADLQTLDGNAVVGSEMNDGSIFAGLSSETNTPLFVMPHSAGVRKTFNEAAEYAAELCRTQALGHDDWRLPTHAELLRIYAQKNNNALAKAFNADSGIWYWSSTPSVDNKIVQVRFDNGSDGAYTRTDQVHVCCVRSPKPNF